MGRQGWSDSHVDYPPRQQAETAPQVEETPVEPVAPQAVVEPPKADPFGFDPNDYGFLSPDAARKETIQYLASLELKKHRLRLEMVANNDSTIVLQNDKTIVAEIAYVDNAINYVLRKFSNTLVNSAN